MGKWTALLAEAGTETQAGHTPSGTDRADTRGVLSALAVGAQACTHESRHHRADDLAAARLDRLLRWGWPLTEAEATAERLARRDAEADDRVSCAADCTHYRLGYCGNHRRAGLTNADIGRELATMLQRCPGFQPMG